MIDFLTICETAVRAGGKVLLDWRGRAAVQEKGPKDYVTQADLESQEAIRRILLGAFPHHLFLGEESAHDTQQQQDDDIQNRTEKPYRWIVDPLDGTANYMHGMSAYSVSVALERDGDLLVGGVYDPLADECFSAVAGGGAFLNGQPLHTSSCETMGEALMAVSFAANVPRGSIQIRRFVEILHAAQAVRRLGSAALNLCYVAAGRLDGYTACSVKSWDVAAGVLIVREAGGVVTSIDGSVFQLAKPRFACASTQALHQELLGTLAQSQ